MKENVITESKNGFIKTKTGWIPEDWGYKKIKNIAPLQRGFDLPLQNIQKGKYPVVYSNGVLRTHNEFKAEAPGVITGRSGTIGKVTYIEQDYWPHNTSLWVTNFYDNYPMYIYYLYIYVDLTRFKAGSGVPTLNRNDVHDFYVPLPPLSEQKKIAKILSTWDEAIEQNQKLIEQLKLRKKGLMQQLLTGKKRLAGFDGEWEEKKLEGYFKERKETNLDNLPLLSIGIEGVYPQDDSNKKDTSNSDKSKYKRICVGDIGYNTMRMWQGRSALSDLEGIVSPAYTIVVPKKNADSLFFSYLFKLDEVIHKFYRNSQGMVSDTWMCKFKDFKIVKFLAPTSKEEQVAISKIIKSCDEEIQLQEQKLESLQQQKKGLMQKLLTGQIRVSTND